MIDLKTLSANDTELRIYSSPPTNWRIRIADTSTWLHVYTLNPPNRFQRWLWYRLLRVKWEPKT